MLKTALIIAGILLALAGLCFLSVCVFHEGKNQMLLSIGLLCNSVAMLLLFIVRRIV